MSKSLTWRGAIALFAILMALVYLVPSIPGEVPAWWSNILPKDKIHLGLDLQGGMHLVLEVQASKAIENHLERVVDEMKGDLREDKIRYLALKRVGLDGVTITIMRSKDETVFQDMVAAGYSDFTGGIHARPKRETCISDDPEPESQNSHRENGGGTGSGDHSKQDRPVRGQ